MNLNSFLNIAAICPGTAVLGPGWRFVIWVQGCPFRCPGCISPEWQVKKEAMIVNIFDLGKIILTHSKITGLTYSGGEPMEQALGLAELTKYIRFYRPNMNFICFTGYQYEELKNNPPNQGVPELLAQIDVLIDGPYIERLNNDRGLRGSSNQNIIYLTEHLKGYKFDNIPRSVNVFFMNDESFLVGIPTKKFLLTWEKAHQSAQINFLQR